MYRVLLAVDTSVGRAKRQAEYVASRPCAEQVSVLVGHGTVDTETTSGGPSQLDVIDSVDRAVEILSAAGIEYETRLLPSPPHEGILQLAEEWGVEEIVMGGRKRTPAEKAILGSVSQKVVLNTDVPVVITGGPESSDE